MRFRKKTGLTDNIVQKKDNISQLKNDKDYADYDRVKKIICDVVTAEFIEAANAKFTQAQIDQLIAGDIQVNGALTAEKVVVTDPSSGETLFNADGTTLVNGKKVVTIAGWNVNKDELVAPNNNVSLYSGAEKTKQSLINNQQSPVRIMAGSNQPSTAKFVVLDDGSLYAAAGQFGAFNSDSGVVNSTIMNGDFITNKYDIWNNRVDVNNYLIIINKFYMHNEQWCFCIHFDKDNISPTLPGGGRIISNTYTMLLTYEALFSGYSQVPWNSAFWPVYPD